MRGDSRRTTTPERIMLYEESKRIYDALTPKPNAIDLYIAASKVLPKSKRGAAGGYNYIMFNYVTGQPVESKSKGQLVTWTPVEWTTVARAFETHIAQGCKTKKAAMMAMQLLPQNRRRKGATIPNEIGKVLRELKKHESIPKTSDPFPIAPKPIQVSAPQAPAIPEHPKYQSAPTNSDLGAAVFNMLGQVFTKAIQEAATLIGKEIGASVSTGLADALYQMRMGLLTGRNDVPAIAVQPVMDSNGHDHNGHNGNGSNGHDHAPDNGNGNLPANLRKQKVMVVGLLGKQANMVAPHYPHLTLRFLGADTPAKQMGNVSDGCDAAFVMTKFIGHSTQDRIHCRQVPVNGGITELKLALNERYPRHQTH